MQTKFDGGYYFDEVAGKKKRYFEAVGVPIPVASREEEDGTSEEDEDSVDKDELAGIPRIEIEV